MTLMMAFAKQAFRTFVARGSSAQGFLHSTGATQMALMSNESRSAALTEEFFT